MTSLMASFFSSPESSVGPSYASPSYLLTSRTLFVGCYFVMLFWLVGLVSAKTMLLLLLGCKNLGLMMMYCSHYVRWLLYMLWFAYVDEDYVRAFLCHSVYASNFLSLDASL